MTTMVPPRLVLASASAARQAMLRRAGLTFTVRPPDLDEAAIKTQMGSATPAALAAALAEAKAAAIPPGQPSALVIGADQTLSCDGELFHKADDTAAAAKILQRLQGRRHELHAAVCVLGAGRASWRHASTVKLWMRPLSAHDIARYLDRAGPGVLDSVGCYQIEGLGVQLFERIEGDYFTILGLPLLPLLQYLRGAGVSPA